MNDISKLEKEIIKLKNQMEEGVTSGKDYYQIMTQINDIHKLIWYELKERIQEIADSITKIENYDLTEDSLIKSVAKIAARKLKPIFNETEIIMNIHTFDRNLENGSINRDEYNTLMLWHQCYKAMWEVVKI